MAAPDVTIGLEAKARQELGALLNALLADEFVLYTKTRNYHWNVTGPTFSQLHAFFESQYDQLDEAIDDIAERVRALGGRSAGSLKEFLAAARLSEDTGAALDAAGMVRALLADHEALIRQLRQDVARADALGDAGTNDFLTGLMESHEKMAWMLRATLA